jgi:hypothetical protein
MMVQQADPVENQLSPLHQALQAVPTFMSHDDIRMEEDADVPEEIVDLCEIQRTSDGQATFSPIADYRQRQSLEEEQPKKTHEESAYFQNAV